MSVICFYFQVHQPFRLRPYSFFDVGASPFYEDAKANGGIMTKVARKCYLPMNEVLLKLIRRYEGDFRVSFSISGTALDQFELYAPEVLESFRDLVDTGCVELLGETYYHSLSFLFSREEFREQVALHSRRVRELFGVSPRAFRNTELVYNNEVARCAEDMGFQSILAEGVDRVLGWRSPNYLYKAHGCKNMNLLLKNYRLSDDIAFRFSNRDWVGYPLTAEKFASWVHAIHSGGLINLFMDYETFGEHQWESTGIFPFMENLPHTLLRDPNCSFMTVSEAAMCFQPAAEMDIPEFVSWADMERDLTAWLGNDLQKDAAEALYGLEEAVKGCGDANLLASWRKLQTSDHFYYMCTKWFSDGDVHHYFNPYDSPYQAYITYMNVLADLSLRISAKVGQMNDSARQQSTVESSGLPVAKALA